MNSKRLLAWVATRRPALVVLCDHSPALDLPTDVTPVRVAGCLADAPDYFLPEVMTLAKSVAVECSRRTPVLEALPLAEIPPPARFRRAQEVDATDIPVPRRVPVSSGIDTEAPADVRLARALDTLGITLDVPAEAAHLSVTGCVACTVCVKACPEQALALVDGTLLHNRDLCDGCLRCVSLCPPQVLRSEGTVDITNLGVVALESMPTAVCSKCGDVYRDTGTDLCPTCTARRDTPFGVVRPY